MCSPDPCPPLGLKDVLHQLQRIPLATSCQPPSLPWLKSDITQDNLDPPDPVTGQPLGRKTQPPHPKLGQLWKGISTWMFQMGVAEASELQMGVNGRRCWFCITGLGREGSRAASLLSLLQTLILRAFPTKTTACTSAPLGTQPATMCPVCAHHGRGRDSRKKERNSCF